VWRAACQTQVRGRLAAESPTIPRDLVSSGTRAYAGRASKYSQLGRAIVHAPPRPVARFRETLARRRHFVRLEIAQVNAVKRLLRGAGLGRLSRSLGTEVGWAKLLATLAGHGELRDYVELTASSGAVRGRSGSRWSAC